MTDSVFKQKFDVPFKYPIVFTAGFLAKSNTCLEDMLPRDKAKCLFIIEEKVNSLHPLQEMIENWFSRLDRLECMEPLVLEGGEQIKNTFSIVDKVAQKVVENRLDRHSIVVIIGGGALLDAVGFALSIIHRGIRHIRVPTTVMAQLDSGVGVKNGINGFGQKNFFGSFSPPHGVICDFDFLDTLEDRDFYSGFSEAFKVVIIKDRKFLQFLLENAYEIRKRNCKTTRDVIIRCATLHLDHIRGSGDPFERGRSRPLDFGHWLGHRIEYCTKHELRHGEAVAIGIALDMCIALLNGMIEKNHLYLVFDAMKRSGLELWHPILESKENGPLLMEGLEQFREHLGGKLTLAMPHGLGNMAEINSLSEAVVVNALKLLYTYNSCGEL